MDEQIKKLFRLGYSHAAIAQEVGVSRPTITRLCKSLQLKRPRGYDPLRQGGRPPDPVDTNRIAQLHGEGKTRKEIAAVVGVEWWVVKRHLGEMGLSAKVDPQKLAERTPAPEKVSIPGIPDDVKRPATETTSLERQAQDVLDNDALLREVLRRAGIVCPGRLEKAAADGRRRVSAVRAGFTGCYRPVFSPIEIERIRPPSPDDRIRRIAAKDSNPGLGG